MPPEGEQRAGVKLARPQPELPERAVGGNHTRDATLAEPLLRRRDQLQRLFAGVRCSREVADEAHGLIMMLLVTAIDEGCASSDVTVIRGQEQGVLDVPVEACLSRQEFVLVGIDRRYERGLASVQLSLEADKPLPPVGVISGDLADGHGCVL
jgi:hypothetical protein